MTTAATLAELETGWDLLIAKTVQEEMEAWEVDVVAQTLATLEGLKAGREVVW